MPWYITAVGKGEFHYILDGPFDKKSIAKKYYANYKEKFKLKAGEKYGEEATVEIVFIDESNLSKGTEIKADKVRYGRRKKSIKRPEVHDVREYLDMIREAKLEKE